MGWCRINHNYYAIHMSFMQNSYPVLVSFFQPHGVIPIMKTSNWISGMNLLKIRIAELTVFTILYHLETILLLLPLYEFQRNQQPNLLHVCFICVHRISKEWMEAWIPNTWNPDGNGTSNRPTSFLVSILLLDIHEGWSIFIFKTFRIQNRDGYFTYIESTPLLDLVHRNCTN